MVVYPAPSVDAVVTTLRAAGCVFAEEEAGLLIDGADSPEALNILIRRRVDGEPLEHLLGWVGFCGMKMDVDPGVFVPRRRTEFLVTLAGRLAGPDPVILDMCCGSGAVGAALGAIVGATEIYAADIDPVAVRCAERNIGDVGGRVFQGDLYAALPTSLRGRVDLLVTNAPYVPTAAIAMMPPEARLYEPMVALDGGTDGLEIQRRVIAEAPQWLAPGGHFLIETSEQQADRTVAAVRASGMRPQVFSDDEEYYATVVIGVMP